MSKWVANLTWSDAPHLTEEMKQEMLAGLMPHEIDMRSKGLPSLGHGAIYPVRESDITIPTFQVPDHWPCAFGMDVGYDHPTAVIWGAYNQKEDTWYLYSEYRVSRVEPAIHADAIRSRGVWIPGIIDSHSNRRSESGQVGLMTLYDRLGLNIHAADNGPGTLDPSLLEIYQRLSSGRLRVMSHLVKWFEEFRLYRRDGNGKIIKIGEDLMDATRYLIMNGREVAEIPPQEEMDDEKPFVKRNQGQSPICGY